MLTNDELTGSNLYCRMHVFSLIEICHVAVRQASLEVEGISVRMFQA